MQASAAAYYDIAQSHVLGMEHALRRPHRGGGCGNVYCSPAADATRQLPHMPDMPFSVLMKACTRSVHALATHPYYLNALVMGMVFNHTGAYKKWALLGRCRDSKFQPMPACAPSDHTSDVMTCVRCCPTHVASLTITSQPSMPPPPPDYHAATPSRKGGWQDTRALLLSLVHIR